MAKKKSKRFIIPSIHFLTTHPVAKIQEAVAVKPNRPEPGPPVAFKKPAEKTKSAPPEPVKAPAAPKPMKPQPLQPSARRNSALSLSSLKRKKEEDTR